MTIIDSENKIKEQLKYIETQKERSTIAEVNANPLKRCVMNEMLYYRAIAR